MGDIADYYRHELLVNESFGKALKPLLHQCKDGKVVDVRGVSSEFPKMDDKHLINTINYIIKRAKEGIVIKRGGGSTPEDFWYDEEHLKGKKALKHMKFKKYLREAHRRGLIEV